MPLNIFKKVIDISHCYINNIQSSFFIAKASRAAVRVCLKALLTQPQSSSQSCLANSLMYVSVEALDRNY